MIGRAENRAMVKELDLRLYKIRSVDLKKYHNIALVDTQPSFENNSFPSRRKATIVLDQHGVLKDPWSDFFIVDPDCGASCVIVARALLEMELNIPDWLGTALVYGILTDTSNFSRAYHSELIQTYQKIIPSCDMRALSRIQNPARSKGAFTALGRGIRRAVNHRGLLVSHLGEVSHPDMVSMVADFLLTYQRAEKSFCTGRYNGRLHMSLRLSKGNTSAGAILRDVVENKKDAGGHGMIAGGSIKVSDDPSSDEWEKAEQKLTRELLKRLRLPTTKEPYYPFRRNAE
jgi:nanoRNase/pAp phosphatase (c-di-AMP/oligoRNAs hydrolase)